MTREELKEYCIKRIQYCEQWAEWCREEPHGKVYEEHKLILELLEQESRWISIGERLPEENITVIGTTKFDDIYKAELYDDCGEKKWYANGNFDVPIVAWMPLPNDMAIKAIEQKSVLNKIRAEIEGMYRVILKDTPKDDWAVRWNDCLDEVLEIFDKYNAGK